MPKIHAYSDGRSFYIKANHQGRITTYQVTPSGVQLLLKHGFRGGSYLNTEDLIAMINARYVYTGNSGPGHIDYTPDIPQDYRHIQANRPSRSWQRQNKNNRHVSSPIANHTHNQNNTAHGNDPIKTLGCIWVTIALIIIFFIIFSKTVS